MDPFDPETAGASILRFANRNGRGAAPYAARERAEARDFRRTGVR
jgi:hypothetical protein